MVSSKFVPTVFRFSGCRGARAGPDAPTFEVLTTPNAKQKRALALLQQIGL
jgi:hypothetical protein